MNSMLLLNHHGLGNVVMSIPLLRAFSSHLEQRGNLFVLFRSYDHYRLLDGERLKFEPLFLEREFEGYRGLLRLTRKLRGLVEAIVAVPQIPLPIVLLLKFALGADLVGAETFARYRLLTDFYASKSWTKSIQKSQKEIAAAAGLALTDNPTITLSSEERAWSRNAFRAMGASSDEIRIGLHSGSDKKPKKWPATYFGEVVRRLKNDFGQLRVLSFGAGGEAEDASIAHSYSEHELWVEGVGQWNVRQSLAMLERCDLVISGDTAIMHMAAAVGTKTLALFGPTSPERVAPAHNGGRVISAAVSCHPCYRDKWKECSCMDMISPTLVYEIARNMLDQLPIGSRKAHDTCN